MASRILTLLPLASVPSSTPKASSSNFPAKPTSYSPVGPTPFLGPLRNHPLVLSASPRFHGHVVRMAPEEEKMTRRSPLDFPIEWERPKPGRRPDIFPQFAPMKTPLPIPMPADPPEEDDEEEEEENEEKEEGEEDPEKENPEEPEKLE